jgi:signal transduction histidine kinase
MLTNLLDNAIRYTKPQGRIVVSLRSSEDGDGWASLRVADDGCGIAPDKLPRIFDRFYRADESRARQTGNAGLGLAICKSIVEAHGGTIDVESIPGEGTIFTVHLPLLRNGESSQRTLSMVSGDSKSGVLRLPRRHANYRAAKPKSDAHMAKQTK